MLAAAFGTQAYVGAQAPVVPAAARSSSSCMLLHMLLLQLI